MKPRKGAKLFPRALLVVAFFLVVYLGNAEEAFCETEDPTSPSCWAPKAWVDEVGGKAHQFLQEKIFGQLLAGSSETGFLSHFDNTDPEGDGDKNVSEKEEWNPFFELFDRLVDAGIVAPDSSETKKERNIAETNHIIESLLEKASDWQESTHDIAGLDFLGLFYEACDKAVQQLKNTFGDLLEEVNASISLAMVYYLAEEDSKKNPSWKRRQHRFYDQVTKPVVLDLHDALYASQLSYVDTVQDFRKGLKEFQNNEWEMAYGTTESHPDMPAHFLLIHKKLGDLAVRNTQTYFPWENGQDSELTVALVIRGTKSLADALADALLEPVEYRGGYAHGGILQSGKNLAARYIERLEILLKHSGRDKIRLYLVGHSLGAGAAAIAAMEFHDYDWIKVEAIGYGCPSLLSNELSESAKGYITTVVADADIIPRMSGASMANMILDLMEFDWIDMALEDIEYTLERARSLLSFGKLLPPKETVMQWSKDFMESTIRPKLGKSRERVESVLIPPGNCIHFFRDGVGYTGAFTPCGFFSSVEFARTSVDDHLIMSGYHQALLSVARAWEQDFNFDFAHDMTALSRQL